MPEITPRPSTPAACVTAGRPETSTPTTAVEIIFVIVMVTITAILAKTGMPVPAALTLISGTGYTAVRVIRLLRIWPPATLR